MSLVQNLLEAIMVMGLQLWVWARNPNPSSPRLRVYGLNNQFPASTHATDVYSAYRFRKNKKKQKKNYFFKITINKII